MKQKIFKFSLNKPNNLNNTPEAYCNIIQCGKDKFTIKNYQPIPYAHDDSLAYTGDLYCNNVFICHCHNDGWGGITELTTDSKQEDIRLGGVIVRVNRYKWIYGNTEFTLELDFIADTLACSEDYRLSKC